MRLALLDKIKLLNEKSDQERRSMCDNNPVSGDMGTLVNGSEVFEDNSGSSNRSSNTSFGSKFRVLKRTDQVTMPSV